MPVKDWIEWRDRLARRIRRIRSSVRIRHRHRGIRHHHRHGRIPHRRYSKGLRIQQFRHTTKSFPRTKGGPGGIRLHVSMMIQQQ